MQNKFEFLNYAKLPLKYNHIDMKNKNEFETLKIFWRLNVIFKKINK